MAREPVRRGGAPVKLRETPAEPDAPATETSAKTTTAIKAERPKVSLRLGKASAASVYATPYGSEPVNIDPTTGRAIASSPKPAEDKNGDDRRQRA